MSISHPCPRCTSNMPPSGDIMFGPKAAYFPVHLWQGHHLRQNAFRDVDGTVEHFPGTGALFILPESRTTSSSMSSSSNRKLVSGTNLRFFSFSFFALGTKSIETVLA